MCSREVTFILNNKKLIGIKNKMKAPISPCVSRCSLTEDKICIGCYRSVAEIMEWSKASVSRKNTILLNAEDRANARIEGNA